MNKINNKFFDYFDSLSTLTKVLIKYGSYILLSLIVVFNIGYIAMINNYLFSQYCIYLLSKSWELLSVVVIGGTVLDFLFKRIY